MTIIMITIIMICVYMFIYSHNTLKGVPSTLQHHRLSPNPLRMRRLKTT